MTAIDQKASHSVYYDSRFEYDLILTFFRRIQQGSILLAGRKDIRKDELRVFGSDSIRFCRIFFRICISPGVYCGVPFIFQSGRHEGAPETELWMWKKKFGDFHRMVWNVLVRLL